jgi:hypothetical protein
MVRYSPDSENNDLEDNYNKNNISFHSCRKTRCQNYGNECSCSRCNHTESSCTKCGSIRYCCVMCITGPAGPAGATGSTADTGPTGDTGATGVTINE